MPDGYASPASAQKVLRPSTELLSRPIIDANMLALLFYKVEFSEWDGRPNNSIRHVEIHPPEWNAWVVFSDKQSKNGIGFPVTNILDIKVISAIQGTIIKKQDLMLKLTFNGMSDNLEHSVIINIEDKYVQGFINAIETVRQKEYDEVYWAYRSLTFPPSIDGATMIDIYPLTPFLAKGEEIVWQNVRTDVHNKKVVDIEVLTNYRVFRYDYTQHAGTVILLPVLEDVLVTNQGSKGSTNSTGSYSKSANMLLSSLGNYQAVSSSMGDVNFIYEGRPFITFSGLKNSYKLAALAKSLRDQQSYVQIGGRVESNGKHVHPNTSQVGQTPTPDTHIEEQLISCKTCKNINSHGSKFCNKCGSKLENICRNCGNENPEYSTYCNQCGLALK
ncbi:MAG: zinc ribbon domain-containing protein [Nitrososphaeraceae archaeon]